MTFTDADLKALKERETDGLLQTWLSWDEKQALIARLEAAEAIASHVSDWHTNKNCNGTCTAQISLDAWRKAAGK